MNSRASPAEQHAECRHGRGLGCSAFLIRNRDDFHRPPLKSVSRLRQIGKPAFQAFGRCRNASLSGRLALPTAAVGPGDRSCRSWSTPGSRAANYREPEQGSRGNWGRKRPSDTGNESRAGGLQGVRRDSVLARSTVLLFNICKTTTDGGRLLLLSKRAMKSTEKNRRNHRRAGSSERYGPRSAIPAR